MDARVLKRLEVWRASGQDESTADRRRRQREARKAKMEEFQDAFQPAADKECSPGRRVLMFQRDVSKVEHKRVEELPKLSEECKLGRRKPFMAFMFPGMSVEDTAGLEVEEKASEELEVIATPVASSTKKLRDTKSPWATKLLKTELTRFTRIHPGHFPGHEPPRPKRILPKFKVLPTLFPKKKDESKLGKFHIPVNRAFPMTANDKVRTSSGSGKAENKLGKFALNPASTFPDDSSRSPTQKTKLNRFQVPVNKTFPIWDKVAPLSRFGVKPNEYPPQSSSSAKLQAFQVNVQKMPQ